MPSASERIEKTRVPAALLERQATPFLVVDLKVVQEKYRELERGLAGAHIYYAAKANPEEGIISLLHKLGAGFEVSSQGEMELLLSLGVPPARIISSNTVKMPDFIQVAAATGVEHFAADSPAEVVKLAALAPGCKVHVRLAVSNQGSQWPLERKFGVEPEEALELLVLARQKGLVPYGITFHVGSQCIDPQSWVLALEKSKVLWDMAASRGISLQMLDLGGGLPVPYNGPVPGIPEVASVIHKAVGRLFPRGVQLWIEPGRVLVGEAGTLVTSVIGKAVRNGQNWLYLDVGVFHGLLESLGGIRYTFAAEGGGKPSRWTVAGPSCDGMDVIATDVELPEPEIGERVFIPCAGAYTTVYASRFNGFNVPTVYLAES